MRRETASSSSVLAAARASSRSRVAVEAAEAPEVEPPEPEVEPPEWGGHGGHRRCSRQGEAGAAAVKARRGGRRDGGGAEAEGWAGDERPKT